MQRFAAIAAIQDVQSGHAEGQATVDHVARNELRQKQLRLRQPLKAHPKKRRISAAGRKRRESEPGRTRVTGAAWQVGT